MGRFIKIMYILLFIVIILFLFIVCSMLISSDCSLMELTEKYKRKKLKVMDLQLNMYIRSIDGDIVFLNKKLLHSYKSVIGNSLILKSFYNRIDLVDPGDLVNGYLVINVLRDLDNFVRYIECLILDKHNKPKIIRIYRKDSKIIKTLIAKEKIERGRFHFEK